MEQAQTELSWRERGRLWLRLGIRFLLIAAVVLGGTSMSGGVGTIGGTIIGVLVITVLNDGMIMMGVSNFWQMVIKGVVIVLAVVIDLLQKDLQKKVALQARG